ncbi:hypothetical protein D3C72_1909360 [compost metagenome]
MVILELKNHKQNETSIIDIAAAAYIIILWIRIDLYRCSFSMVKLISFHKISVKICVGFILEADKIRRNCVSAL